MYININNCRLFFDVYGAGLDFSQRVVQEKPTIILLHGGPGVVDHTLYTYFWSRFSDIAQVVFLDHRGNGRSKEKDESSWNLEQWGDDVYSFCEVLGIKNPIVAGVSFGGHVLCSYATRHPEQPGGLIFCDTEARFKLSHLLDAFEERGGKKVREYVKKAFCENNKENTENYLKYCKSLDASIPFSKEEFQRCQVNPAVLQHYTETQLHTFDFLEALKKIQCPSLIFAGENSLVHPPVGVKELAQAIPKNYSQYQLIKGVGSPAYRGAEDKVFNIIRDFVVNI